MRGKARERPEQEGTKRGGNCAFWGKVLREKSFEGEKTQLITRWTNNIYQHIQITNIHCRYTNIINTTLKKNTPDTHTHTQTVAVG